MSDQEPISEKEFNEKRESNIEQETSEVNWHNVQGEEQRKRRDAEVLRLYTSGLSERAIAKAMNINRDTVHAAIEKGHETLAKSYDNTYVQAVCQREIDILEEKRDSLIERVRNTEDPDRKTRIDKEIIDITKFLVKLYTSIDSRLSEGLSNEREYQPN